MFVGIIVSMILGFHPSPPSTDWSIDTSHDPFDGRSFVRATLQAEWGYRGRNYKERLNQSNLMAEKPHWEDIEPNWEDADRYLRELEQYNRNFMNLISRPWGTSLRVVSFNDSPRLFMSFHITGKEKYFKSSRGKTRIGFRFDDGEITSLELPSTFQVQLKDVGWHVFLIEDLKLTEKFLLNLLANKQVLTIRFYQGEVLPTDWTVNFGLSGTSEMLKQNFSGFLPSESTFIQGTPKIIDGDTLRFENEVVRLKGIDSPEPQQACFDDQEGKCYLCGQEATEALKRLIEQDEVRCETEGKGKYGRWIGTCYLKGQDLNEAMVQSGYAIAYRKHSDRYAAQEEEARRAGHGLWSGKFIAPEKWRQGERLFECRK